MTDDVAAQTVQPGQSFRWHAITHKLLSIVQPDVTHVSTRTGAVRRCRYVRTVSSLGTMNWLLADDEEVELLTGDGHG